MGGKIVKKECKSLGSFVILERPCCIKAVLRWRGGEGQKQEHWVGLHSVQLLPLRELVGDLPRTRLTLSFRALLCPRSRWTKFTGIHFLAIQLGKLTTETGHC